MTLTRPTGRTLPVLDLVAPSSVAPAAPPAAPPEADDARLAEYRPDTPTLPRFHVWTLGCQMNRSDSEEMAGRLLAAGCAEASSMDTADLVVINTCAIREAAEQKVIGRQGVLKQLKAANPGMRVVLTGCAVREAERDGLRRRFPAVDLFLRPDEEAELVDRLGLASAQGVVGMSSAATTVVGRATVGAADRLPRARAAAVEVGAVARDSAISAWLPIVYGCDKTCTYCIVPFSRGPERSRPFDDVVAEARALAAAGYREVTLLGQNVNSYGHDLPPDARFADVETERRVGRRLDLQGRPDLAALIRAIDAIRTADGVPAMARLRFVTSHPWDLSDRLIEAMADCPSMCAHLHLPVQSGADAVLHRMGRQYTIEHYLERLARIRDAVPGIAISTDVIVGFCGETDAQFRSTLRLIETVRYDQVFAAAYSERPGTPATRLADDVPADVKRARLNELLALQEGIGLERNRAWIGREVEVLVDSVTPPRSHDHEHESDGGPGDAAAAVPTGPRVAGRSRQNKLVHLAGGPELVGRLVTVRINHAGPYALRGVITGV
ncbi:MAG TPA: tRNA (N6-isopentenyl adenosine(37)-C2)-methylthiotransferase MiaB [Candidatus Limnocylindrales bacterium]|nr:tRNA (N6-isopentenyl adenosine(37)-C2)-methylthiotransferase MiaB [Candidatus Limnocylindrales bacterium]